MQLYIDNKWPDNTRTMLVDMMRRGRTVRIARYAADVVTNIMTYGCNTLTGMTRGGIIEAYRPDINRHGFITDLK